MPCSNVLLPSRIVHSNFYMPQTSGFLWLGIRRRPHNKALVEVVYRCEVSVCGGDVLESIGGIADNLVFTASDK
jgi:hypothetical protein